jgi:hypothetical protein
MARIAGRFGIGRVLCLAALGAVLSGCQGGTGADPALQSGQLVGGATRQITDVQPVAGFLPQPALLRRGEPGQPALFYRNQAADLSAYDKVILDPVTIWAAPDSDLQSVPPDQRHVLANTFHADLYNALGKVCNLVTARSPGTLELRFAVVDAKSTNAVINTVATYAPYGSSAYTLASVAFNKGVGYFAGTATAEGYAIDAMNGAIVWQAVDKRGGTTAMLENTLDTWLDVHHAFEAWSERLAGRLQEAGVCRR